MRRILAFNFFATCDEVENPESEARIPKQHPMTQIQMSETNGAWVFVLNTGAWVLRICFETGDPHEVWSVQAERGPFQISRFEFDCSKNLHWKRPFCFRPAMIAREGKSGKRKNQSLFLERI
jgi:hypothetical protein